MPARTPAHIVTGCLAVEPSACRPALQGASCWWSTAASSTQCTALGGHAVPPCPSQGVQPPPWPAIAALCNFRQSSMQPSPPAGAPVPRGRPAAPCCSPSGHPAPRPAGGQTAGTARAAGLTAAPASAIRSARAPAALRRGPPCARDDGHVSRQGAQGMRSSSEVLEQQAHTPYL